MAKHKPRGQMGTYKCEFDGCGKEFTARVADRDRGWARFCSKSCSKLSKSAQTAKPVEVKSHSRYIEISECGNCPHRCHGGAFGAVSYVPVCRKCNSRKLPHDVVSSGTRLTAVLKPGIPSWCPLPVLGGVDHG